MPFGIGALFGGGQAQEAGNLGAQAAQHQGAAAQQGAGQRFNIYEQQAQGLINRIPQYEAGIQWQRVEPPRARLDVMASIHNMSNAWVSEHLSFTKLVVPKDTYYKMLEDLHIRTRYIPPPIAEVNQPKDIMIYTSMGPVQIVCEDQQGFNLDKYMETVD